MTGGITQQNGIRYGQYGTPALAQTPRTGKRKPITPAEAAIIQQVERADTYDQGTNVHIILNVPKASALADGLPKGSLAAQTFMQKAASIVEHYFDVSGVSAVLGTSDTIELIIDSAQYNEKIAPTIRPSISR